MSILSLVAMTVLNVSIGMLMFVIAAFDAARAGNVLATLWAVMLAGVPLATLAAWVLRVAGGSRRAQWLCALAPLALMAAFWLLFVEPGLLYRAGVHP